MLAKLLLMHSWSIQSAAARTVSREQSSAAPTIRLVDPAECVTPLPLQILSLNSKHLPSEPSSFAEPWQAMLTPTSEVMQWLSAKGRSV